MPVSSALASFMGGPETLGKQGDSGLVTQAPKPRNELRAKLSAHVYERNPSCEGYSFSTQFCYSEMESPSGLSGIRLKIGRHGRIACFEKVFVECLCNLRTIDVGDRPKEIRQNTILFNSTANLPHSSYYSTKPRKQ
jgi:hypothetical protein